MMRPARRPPLASDWLGAVFSGRAAYVAMAQRIVGCRAQAEDVVQDVMLRLAADPPRGMVRTESRYVARMVRNLAIDRVRRARSAWAKRADGADVGWAVQGTGAASRLGRRVSA